MPCSFSWPSISQLETVLTTVTVGFLFCFFTDLEYRELKIIIKIIKKPKRSDHPQIKEALDSKEMDNFLLPDHQTRLCFFSGTCRCCVTVRNCTGIFCGCDSKEVSQRLKQFWGSYNFFWKSKPRIEGRSTPLSSGVDPEV